MTEHVDETPDRVVAITDEAIWTTALSVLAEAPEENEYVDVQTLAKMTAESFGFVGRREPKVNHVAGLLRSKLPRFQKARPDLLARRRPPHGDYGVGRENKTPAGGWFTLYRWIGPPFDEWPKEGYSMVD